MKIMIIDGGPRKGMNTAQMVDYKDAHLGAGFAEIT